MTITIREHEGNIERMTESQKMYAPIPTLDAEFYQAYGEMVNAYRAGNMEEGKKWFDEMLRIERDILIVSGAFRKFLLKRLEKNTFTAKGTKEHEGKAGVMR